MLNIHYDLKVIWVPNNEQDVSGEINGGVIYIYEKDESKALEALKHELVDYHVTVMLVHPLVKYINIQKRYIDALIYERKEELVNGLLKLL